MLVSHSSFQTIQVLSHIGNVLLQCTFDPFLILTLSAVQSPILTSSLQTYFPEALTQTEHLQSKK